MSFHLQLFWFFICFEQTIVIHILSFICTHRWSNIFYWGFQFVVDEFYNLHWWQYWLNYIVGGETFQTFLLYSEKRQSNFPYVRVASLWSLLEQTIQRYITQVHVNFLLITLIKSVQTIVSYRFSLFLAKNCQLKVEKWQKEHGSVCRLYMASTPTPQTLLLFLITIISSMSKLKPFLDILDESLFHLLSTFFSTEINPAFL